MLTPKGAFYAQHFSPQNRDKYLYKHLLNYKVNSLVLKLRSWCLFRSQIKTMQPKQSFDSCNHGVPRIPQALQAVFLDGNRGIEVNTPPSDKSAMKTFRRWTWWSGSSRSKISGVSKESETKPVNANVSVEPKRPKKKKVSDHLLSDCIVGKRSKRFLTAMVAAIHFSHHNCLLCLRNNT
jgi:hypothetical protein